MSDNETNQELNSQPKTRLVKVKRFKPKNPSAPAPEAAPNQFSEPIYGGMSTPDQVHNSLPASVQQNTFVPEEQDENDDFFEPERDSYTPHSDIRNILMQTPLKAIVATSIICFALGFVIAKIITPTQTTVREGLQGVVVNPEVPKGRARCGLVDKTQGCVLYIMNPQRQDLNARDFYDLAAQLTGRQRFVIDTGNMRYSNVKIKPGAIAQFNIPPL